MWKTVKLGEACLVRRGTTITKKQTVEGEVPVIGGGTKPTYFHNESNRAANCITVSGSGASAGFVNKWEAPIFASDCSTIEPKDDTQLHQFVYYYLMFQQQFIYDNFRSGAAQPHVYAKDIETLDYPIVSLAEQQRIVAKLDAAFAEIDRAVELCQQKTLNAESIYANKLTQIFEEKDEDWTCCPLKEITSKIGSGATPKGGKAAYKEDGLSLIRSMNVYDMGFSWRELAKIDDEQAQKLSNVAVEENDVLLNITGASVARCTVAPTDALPARVNQHVAIIRTDKTRLIPTLLAYGLVARINKETLLGVGNNAGATRQAITKRDIEEFVFSFPQKLDAQRHLVDEISSIKHESRKLAEVYRKKHENLIALKSSILAQELQPPQSEAV